MVESLLMRKTRRILCGQLESQSYTQPMENLSANGLERLQVNFDNGITTFIHNFNNKVTVRNGIVVIVESQYKFDDESELDYPP